MPQYQGVWTLQAQSQAQSNQQWVTDPNFKNTTLLLQADGTGSGSQNQTFLDSSTNNFFITRNGNTTQGSFSPFSQAPGYWSNYTSSGNYLSVASNAAFAYGTGAITIEFWEWSTTTPTSAVEVWVSNGSNNLNIQRSSGGFYNVYDGTDRVSTTTVLSNQWNHVAFVRQSGGQTNLYVNGVSVLSWTSSVNYGNDTFVIAGSGSFPFPGYISNIRVLKGTSLYTAAFTPPTSPLTAITNTSLLTCQSNRFIDNSASPLTLTITGSPSVQAFGPFAPALQWTPDVVGGSGYFDGTGDFLTVPSSSAFAFGSSNFTIELWAYWTGNMGVRQDLIHTASLSSTVGFELLKLSGDTIYFGVAGVSITSSITVKAGQWYHIAAVRSSTSTNGLNLYINGVNVGTTTASGSITGNATFAIGAQATGSAPTIGYFSSLRIVNGTAVYTAAFTPPTAPVTAITNTSLLLNYTNAGIYDGKMGNVLETVGNAQVSTSPVKYGSGSIYFNGSSSYLRSQPTTPLFAIGTTYTIEGWFYRLSNTSAGTYTSALELIGTQPFGTTTTGFLLTFGTSGGLYFYDGANATVINYANATTLIPLNQWNHIAVVRAGGGSNNVTLFVNGIAVATGTSSSAQSTVQSYFIGGDTNNNGCFTGYMDDVRVTVGVARYFTNFTPPQQALPRQ